MFTPLELNEAAIASYNEEMHRVLPKIVGDLAVISALDLELFEKMIPLVKAVYDLDSGMARAAATFASDQARATTRMAQYAEPTWTLYKRAEPTRRRDLPGSHMMRSKFSTTEP
jgi:hypothetical protein